MRNYRERQIAKALRLMGFCFGKVGSRYDAGDAYLHLTWERSVG